LPEIFALIVTVKDSEVLRIPTAGPYPAFIEYPSKFKVDLYFQIKDMPYAHAQTYDIDAPAWDKVKVVPKHKG